MCREVNYTFTSNYDAERYCYGPPSRYQVQREWWTKDRSTGLDHPDLLPHVLVEKRAWEHTFDNSAMLMYFRGGDILQVNAHSGYSQAPCSLFLESWNFIKPQRAMLVYDQRTAINPCVQVMEKHIPAHQRVEPPCDGAGCHMTLIGRAPYVVVSGASTIADNSLKLFPGNKRVVFRYFCHREPHNTDNSMQICVNGSNQGLVPWSYTDATRNQMLNIPSNVVLGGLNARYVKSYAG